MRVQHIGEKPAMLAVRVAMRLPPDSEEPNISTMSMFAIARAHVAGNGRLKKKFVGVSGRLWLLPAA